MKKIDGLTSILYSKRANIYYLEYCRIKCKDNRLLYLCKGSDDKGNVYYNIPIANTTCLLLGKGTSITQSAIQMLASAGVLVGFSGSGSTPLLMTNAVEWFTPQGVYRPTEYVQGWLKWWWDDAKKLNIAINFMLARIDFIRKVWAREQLFKDYGFDSSDPVIEALLNKISDEILQQKSIDSLMQLEARFTKNLYKLASEKTKQANFVRDFTQKDGVNSLLNYGHFLSYGLGATTAWVLGIPQGFGILHGKTCRGALVFDIADLVKNALVLPLAFICSANKYSSNDFRQQCLLGFTEYKALDFMFATVKKAALELL